MNDLLSPKVSNLNLQASNEQQTSRFFNGGLHIREDDQDWGSAGMNDIQQEESE